MLNISKTRWKEPQVFMTQASCSLVSQRFFFSFFFVLNARPEEVKPRVLSNAIVLSMEEERKIEFKPLWVRELFDNTTLKNVENSARRVVVTRVC